MPKKNRVAVLYEGEKTERIIFNAIKGMFFCETVDFIIIHMPLTLNIYMLWNKLKKDEFETDIIEIARESCEKASAILDEFTRDDFSEVFLFLDLDFHSANNNLKGDKNALVCLSEMIDAFSNETDNGKLYINYPMIESLKCYNESSVCDKGHCYYYCDKGKQFKGFVSTEGKQMGINKYTPDDWKKIFCYTVSKANCIVNGEYMLASYNGFRAELTQKHILNAECEKHIPYNRIALISGMSLFLLEYHQESFYDLYIKD